MATTPTVDYAAQRAATAESARKAILARKTAAAGKAGVVGAKPNVGTMGSTLTTAGGASVNTGNEKDGSITPVYTPGSKTISGQGPNNIATGSVLNTMGAYNPYTGGYETTNKNVAVNTGAYSPDAKNNLWTQSGNTVAMDMNAFYRKSDGTLGIKPEFVKNTNPNTLSGTDSVNAYLNGVQNNNFVDNGGDKNSTEWGTMLTDIKTALGSGNAPENYSRVDAYNKARADAGVTDLETQIADLDKQEADVRASMRQRSQAEIDKPIAMGVIGGRVSEIERQDNERLDSIGRQKMYATSQLNAKNQTIETMMKLQGEDYATSAQRYDADFSKNLQMINLARGLKSDQMTENEKLQDNARATLQTVYNSIISGSMDPKSMTDTQKAQVTKLELQSGMPAGFVQNLYDKNPKSDIVFSSRSTEADGKDYLQVVLRDKVTGEMKTAKQLLGTSATYDLKKQAANLAASKAAKKGGTGGKSTGSSTASANKKTEDALNADVSKQVEAIGKGTIDRDTAHATIYAKYNSYLSGQGFSDAQVKNAIHRSLGGK